ncbi:hypothetical protein OG497_11075 [Streptomyces sp. NBC_01242]|uniref:hypothetical protein n=1 Tax=unclassified Streptomyces TaxID=2593676 RepID=UPI002252EE13|nr:MULTISPECIES: hypothetical protein [unclassified Streptomyces]WSP57753.1 hypothetical protein OG306_27755 [Streptomyces sp. NBC_01241]WSU21511.1 hypothetical protein OG508_11355 [Streptomyces sp. NBC_01108]WTE36465.1 hypothetical protein OH735_27055 [Streptomyces sp. NBC_01618]MCX4794641.1 hypothetical protein [Streptomyces sp. NBC_01242]WSJ35974.1 hypothetical protein OG772_07925 [Streptomyces sp. NBC_01321]
MAVVMSQPPRSDPGVQLSVGGRELLDDGEEAGCGGFYEGSNFIGESVGRGGE